MALEEGLSTMGQDLLDKLTDPPYRTLRTVYADLSAVRTGLARYGETCFRTLLAAAGAYGQFSVPLHMADQDGDRKRAQLQVMATAAVGLDILRRCDPHGIVDPALVTWKVNLERIRYEICPNCPVVSAPDLYRDGCPVMLMSGTAGKKNEIEPR